MESVGHAAWTGHSFLYSLASSTNQFIPNTFFFHYICILHSKASVVCSWHFEVTYFVFALTLRTDGVMHLSVLC